MDHPTERPSKKSQYVRPELVRYGDLIEITKALGHKGNTDGGRGQHDKTG